MKTLKMSLENIQGKISRKEMRNIMAGSDGGEITCYRPYGSITGSPELCAAWAAAWTSLGQSVNCSNGYSNGIYFV